MRLKELKKGDKVHYFSVRALVSRTIIVKSVIESDFGWRAIGDVVTVNAQPCGGEATIEEEDTIYSVEEHFNG